MAMWVSTRKGLFRLERGAAGWEVAAAHFVGHPVTLCLPDARDGAVYAALDLGHYGAKLHRSDDGGATWTELAAPAYPKADDAEEDDPSGPAVKTIWALEGGGADRPGVLWCGTIPGGLFRSEDRGESWTLNTPLWDRPERATKWFGGGADQPGIHSILVDPRDSDRVILGVSCGGVWRTADGGQTWAQSAHGMRADFLPPDQQLVPDSQDPHQIVRSPSHPDVLWAQHHCGIFKSTNDGHQWEEVTAEPSSFGFGVAVHPSDPQRAWFVPGVKDATRLPVDGKLVVTRTSDGGASFDVLRAGLPQQHAYDLVYRHALAIDGTGDVLAFGSTTGNLFATDDGGESWTAVSQHLPPIYAVRFG